MGRGRGQAGSRGQSGPRRARTPTSFVGSPGRGARGNLSRVSEEARTALDKEAYRAAVRARRRRLDPTEHAVASAAIVGHVVADSSFVAAVDIAGFVGALGEPDTYPLLQRILLAGKRLWLPKVRSEDPPRMQWFPVDSLERLQPGAFGILEPPDGPPPAQIEHLGLILVPGLAFSSAGARLGSGRGYYDRALATVRDAHEVVRMGVCFASFLDPAEGPVPTQPHDIPVHRVATERGITVCT